MFVIKAFNHLSRTLQRGIPTGKTRKRAGSIPPAHPENFRRLPHLDVIGFVEQQSLFDEFNGIVNVATGPVPPAARGGIVFFEVNILLRRPQKPENL